MAKGAEGRVVQIIGTVVDIEFPPDELPSIYNAVEIEMGDGQALVAEVEQHMGNNWVRCLAMGSTDGMRRGARAVDTGEPISVPVGRACLGRLFNVLGQPLDNLGEVKAEERWPIHRPPPPLEERTTSPQMLETGLKVIDLICPFRKGGKVGAYGGAGVGKTVIIMELIRNIASLRMPVSPPLQDAIRTKAPSQHLTFIGCCGFDVKGASKPLPENLKLFQGVGRRLSRVRWGIGQLGHARLAAEEAPPCSYQRGDLLGRPTETSRKRPERVDPT